MVEIENPIQEAERYLSNAKNILSKNAGKDGDYYTDSKYVKLAGHAAWCGVLVALDGVLKVKENKKKGQRVEFKDYQEAMSKKDKKMNIPLRDAYEILHKSLSYDGILRYNIVQDSLLQAKLIMDWASNHYNQN